MTDTHVISALKEKRIQVASQIEALQGQIKQAVIALDHVEASLRLFDPDVDIAALSPRKVAPTRAKSPIARTYSCCTNPRDSVGHGRCLRSRRKNHNSSAMQQPRKNQIPEKRKCQLWPTRK
jgi:hypothetical protein